MPTEEDLRATLLRIEDLAGDPAALRDRIDAARRGPRRARQRTAALAVAATVAAVLAVVLAATVVLDGGSAGPSATSPTGPPSTAPSLSGPIRTTAIPAPETGSPTPETGWLGQAALCRAADTAIPLTSFTLDAVPGFVAGTRFDACQGWRSRQLVAPDGARTTYDVGVTVFDPGVFDPTAAKRGQAVSVNGRRGWYTARPTVEVPALAWEYADDAWAVVSWEPGQSKTTLSRDQLLTIATAVRTAPAVLPSAFRLSWLPSGMLPQSAGSVGAARDASQFGAVSQIGFARPGAPTADCVTEVFCGHQLQVNAEGTSDTRYRPGATDTPVDINGSRGGVGPALGELRLTVLVDGWRVTITTPEDSGITAADLIRIARGMTLADKDDLSTWFDATTAVP